VVGDYWLPRQLPDVGGATVTVDGTSVTIHVSER
jgi:hypothetical protein